MCEKQKTIAVLTSGGDAPGMNAAVRSVVLAAAAKGMRVLGIRKGYLGLLHEDFIELTVKNVSNIINLGSTMLLSARCPEFKGMEKVKEGVEICKKHGICGIVVIGGDGSYRGARDLSVAGLPCIGLPGTIDNDIGSTDYAIGYDTAVNTAVKMVDNLRDTITSHSRCNIVEVMGRTVGHIALQVAASTGAIACITAETEPEFDVQRDLIDKINRSKKEFGQENFIVIVAEGYKKGDSHFVSQNGETELEVRSRVMGDLARTIEAGTGVETRATIFGHVLRGGNPTARDRVLATRFGYRAVELLSQGIGNRVVGIHHDQVVDYDILEGLSMKVPFNFDLYHEISRANH